jgi:ElaA protein
MTGWRFAHFDELTAREVHDILQARSAVFVVEQACVFQDMDGADVASWHLFARRGGRSRTAARPAV